MVVVGAVGVVDDAGAGVDGHAVLVDDPFEGGAVAEAVVEGGGGDAVEGEEVVVAKLGFVFGVQPHLFYAEGDHGLRVFYMFQQILSLLLAVDVEVQERFASRRPAPETLFIRKIRC